MSQALLVPRSTKQSTGDVFVAGVAAMLVINIVQRIVGLGRNLGFSMFLSEEQLGMWALANSFFIIAPPFIVLGLPGSFGKFVEFYRTAGSLRTYLTRTSLVCAVALVAMSALVSAYPERFAVSVYGQSQTVGIVFWTLLTLIILSVHNILLDVVLSLRQVKLVSVMQFVNSVSFCLLGVVAIYLWENWWVLLPCYAIACMLAMLPGFYGLFLARMDFKDTTILPSRQMWRRILPFAVAMWLTNFLTNSFELCDRYMLVHCSGLDSHVSQAMVGQFYCGRILPNLLLSLAMMLSGVVLPYLSADWESKKFAKIGKDINTLLVTMSMVFTCISICALVAAPILYDRILAGRFSPAFEILPLGLIQATWSGLTMVGATYLLCAEKGRQNALMLTVGLAVNVALNWLLIRQMGLYGAALATTASSATLLGMLCWRLQAEGCRINFRTVAIACLPICLAAGVFFSLGLVLCLAIVSGRTDWLLTQEDRHSIDQLILPKLRRLGIGLSTIW